MDAVLVIDIGGTKTQIAVISTPNKTSLLEIPNKIKVLYHHKFPTPKEPAKTIKLICDFSRSFNIRFKQMSLSLPGLWSDEGVLLESDFLSGWVGYPFINKLSNALKIKKYVWETDVICGGLGEYYFNKKQCLSLLYINLGTGIGASFIRDGKPFKSTGGLTIRLQKLLLPNKNKFISATNLVCGGNLLKYKNIPEGSYVQLACLLTNLYYLFAPEYIVLNGGLTDDWNILCSKACKLIYPEVRKKMKIIPSELKERAPIYGAYVNLLLNKGVKK